MFRKFNLKIRMLLSICSVAFLAFAVTIAFVAIKASNMAKTEAIDKAEQIAYRYSGVVKAELEVAMDAARTTAQLFEGVKNSADSPSRSNLNTMLKQLLERNPGFIGVWTGTAARAKPLSNLYWIMTSPEPVIITFCPSKQELKRFLTLTNMS